MVYTDAPEREPDMVDDYEQVMQDLRQLNADWKAHLLPILQEKRVTAAMIAAGCEVTQSTARSFVEQIPAKRENVIMLAMILRLSVKQTNDLLMRWAKYQKLYSRNPNDAIWIFLLEKGGNDRPRSLFRRYYAAYEQVREEYKQNRQHAGAFLEPMNTQILFEVLTDEAQQCADGGYNEVDSHFTYTMRMSMASFDNGYRKLLDYINKFFRELPREASGGESRWRTLYRQKIEALEKYQTMPGRSFLIAVGRRMRMNARQINTMLDLAGMGPLCTQDAVEGTAVFYLEEKQDPARTKRRRPARQPEMVSSIALDFADNPEAYVSDYIKRADLGADVFEFGYDDYLTELSRAM